MSNVNAVNDRRLQCGVFSLSYDFTWQEGALHMNEGDTCDMQACVDLFTAIHGDVQVIRTFAGEALDTVYRKSHSGEWHGMPG